MIKAVVDTNIFVSGIIKEEGSSGQLIKLWKENKFILVTSREIINEIAKVLNYSKIKDNYHITDERIKALIDRIYLKAEIVEGLYQIKKTKDITDNKLLACGLEGRVDCIVTGDNELLELRHFQEINIVNINTFLNEFF